MQFTEKILATAYDYGAEARANNRPLVLSSDDRNDLLLEIGVDTWSQLPSDLVESITVAFSSGYNGDISYTYSKRGIGFSSSPKNA